MQKAFLLSWKRQDITTDAFIHHYESVHAGIIATNLPRPSDIRRNCPIWDGGDDGDFGAPPFGVVTAITYPSHAVLAGALHVRHTPPAVDVIDGDEENFLDRSRLKLMVVDEIIDGQPEGGWTAPPVVPSGAKLLRFGKWTGGVDTAKFRRRYETDQAPVTGRLLHAAVDYRRNYVVADELNFSTPQTHSDAARSRFLDCDLVEEFSFPDVASAESAAHRLSAASAGDIGGIASFSPILLCDVRVDAPPIGDRD